MSGTSNFLVLGLGFVLGLKHATDPDHIVAVTTFLGEERLPAACLCNRFVLGIETHDRVIDSRTDGHGIQNFDVEVARGPARTRSCGNADHPGGAAHLYRSHALARASSGFRTSPIERRLFVGIVHLTAGSAALTLVVLSTISSTMNGLLYILIFGIGSMLGMLTISVLLARPLQFAGERMNSAIRPIQMSTGILSCASSEGPL